DTALSALMAKRGFGEPKKTEGRGLLNALKATYEVRQVTLGTQGERATASEADEKVARTKYADFRGTVRTTYTNADTRKALGVAGLVPVDSEKFLTLAEVGYSAAAQIPYAVALKGFGFDAAERATSLATLTVFKAAREAHRGAIAAAKAATRERDDAYKVALKWNRDLLRMAKITLRERLDLLAKLR
ncbi:hypothetical protein, partial [Armatimonas sp.]|uniref:hypothetical protein n=1 Tax=Armatimonas sp. TaxID=1872638 RepID=UPI0037536C08